MEISQSMNASTVVLLLSFLTISLYLCIKKRFFSTNHSLKIGIHLELMHTLDDGSKKRKNYKESKIDDIEKNLNEEKCLDRPYFYSPRQKICPHESTDYLYNGVYKIESDDELSQAIQLYISTHGDETP